MTDSPDDLRKLFAAGLQPGPFETESEIQPPELDGIEIETLLGQGGMGVVYLARNKRLNRPVALKVLHGDGDTLEAERLSREGKVLAKLDHAHILRVYDVLFDQVGHPCLMLEYVEGGDLADRIQAGGYSVEQALIWFRQIVEAVAHAHSMRVLHRDLKPSNILFDPSGMVKVGDFGLAALDRSEVTFTLTLSGTTAGTEAYMSPEQRNGEKLDAGTDVYSLGVILYEMLTGRRPQGIFSALKDKRLDRIVRTCLLERSEDRYSSCEALLQELDRTPNRWLPYVAFGTVVLSVLGFLGNALLRPSGSESESASPPLHAQPTSTPVPLFTPAPRAVAPSVEKTDVNVLSGLEENLADLRSRGNWSFEEGALVVQPGRTSQAWIELPSAPGESYDLEVVATRLTGTDSLPIVFPTSSGVVAVELDAWRQGIGGFQLVDGQDLRSSGRSFPIRYQNGVPLTVLIRVRREQLQLWVNGELKSTLALQHRELSKPGLWEFPQSLQFGVGAWESSARFDRIVWRPIDDE